VIEATAKVAMVSLLAATTPTASVDLNLWAQWGLAGLVVAYTLWRDAHRERRMALAMESQQRWIRDTLVRALERNSAAMERIAQSGGESHDRPE
jgi:hypothetical protein